MFLFNTFLLFCSLNIMERPPFWVGTYMCCEFVAPTIEVSVVDLRVALRNGSCTGMFCWYLVTMGSKWIISGQISSRPHTVPSPQKVRKGRDIPESFREIQVGEILFHLARIFHPLFQ